MSIESFRNYLKTSFMPEIVLTIALVAGMKPIMEDDYDLGTDNEAAAMSALMTGVSNLEKIQTDLVQDNKDQREILTLEKQLSEKKNGEWAYNAPKQLEYVQSDYLLNAEQEQIKGEISKLNIDFKARLLSTVDISEDNYVKVSDAFSKVSDTRLAWSDNPRSLRECQVYYSNTAHLSTDSEAKIDTIEQCMSDRDDFSYFYAIPGFVISFLLTTLLASGLGAVEKHREKTPKKRSKPDIN